MPTNAATGRILDPSGRSCRCSRHYTRLSRNLFRSATTSICSAQRLSEARCPACEQALAVKGDLDPNPAVKTHFAHRRDSNAPVCPIKSEGAIRYQVFTESLPDTDAAAALRASFFENWTYHWHQFKKYVGTADVKDFAQALREVDTKGVWKYRGIQEHEVIIAMLATRDFKPIKDKNGKVLRSRWVRFWFRSEVEALQEFWNLGDGQKVMIRAEYDLSARATKIREDAFQDFGVLAVDSSYLENEAYAEVPTFVHIIMSERFPRLIDPPV